MKNLYLVRVSQIPDGTFGVLLDEVIPFCVTLEREWLDNERGKSCIPRGIYMCKRILSPKFGNTFEVCDVPNRSEILFHKGNLEEDSHGCILLGEQFEPLGGANAVLSSGKAMKEFLMRTTGVDEFILTVRLAF